MMGLGVYCRRPLDCLALLAKRRLHWSSGKEGWGDELYRSVNPKTQTASTRIPDPASTWPASFLEMTT